MEFDSAEVTRRLGSFWWKDFRHKSDNGRKSLIDGSRAIVWGLLGVDTEHYAHSELHPMYAMAVEDPSSTQGNDVWRIIVRNWGNEGFCSQFDHPLVDKLVMQIFIPREGARSASLIQQDIHSDPANLEWKFSPVRDGAILTFKLGSASAEPLFDGEVHISWVADTPSANLMLNTKSVAPESSVRFYNFEANYLEVNAPKDVEDVTEEFWNSLQPSQQEEAQTKLATDEQSRSGQAHRIPSTLPRSPIHQYDFVMPPPAPQVATATRVLDEEKIARDLRRSQLVCKFEGEKEKWTLIIREQCMKLPK